MEWQMAFDGGISRVDLPVTDESAATAKVSVRSTELDPASLAIRPAVYSIHVST